MTDLTLVQPTAVDLAPIAAEFLLDPGIAFLNHGSFGACPRPVFATYQRWQRELERQPVEFLGRRLHDLLDAARTRLASFVGAAADRLTFVPNATYGVNVVARSLDLRPGDEVLGTDHEYGAVNNTWRFNCAKRGAVYINHPMPLPFDSADEFVERFWAAVTPRTRVISISHITSPTALIFPVAEICRRANDAGILTVIDGAHALGQIDLDLDQIGATYYTGNAHKWLCAPKGSAFLYAKDGHATSLDPLVVSHGWSRPRTGSQFLDFFSWTGTMDPSAYLSVPAAIDFHEQHDWAAVRAACHRLALDTQARILAWSGFAPLAPDDMCAQMIAIPIPGRATGYRQLWEEFRVEVPIHEWNGQTLVRVSVQAYTRPDHIDRLLHGLITLHARA